MSTNRSYYASSPNLRTVLRIGLIMVFLLSLGLQLTAAAVRNRAFSQASTAVIRQPVDYSLAWQRLEPLVPQDCRINWQISLLALRMDKLLEVESNLDSLLDCTPASASWLFLIVPQRVDLAYRTAQRYPQEAVAWFWLGEIARGAEDSALANQYFAESVRINPSDGLGWCRLGAALHQQGQLQDAMEAYWQCCQNGDPGSNGCYRAGRVAEELGDIPAAIRYYRRSHWQTALQRADELEGMR